MPRADSQSFDPRWVRLGFRHTKKDPRYNPRANAYQIPLRKAERMLVLGKTGAGKTMLLRRLTDYLHHSGYATVFLTDIKDEMKSSLAPAPAAMARLLDADDIAQPMRMRVYRPVFFTRMFRERLPAHNKEFTVAYRDATFPDLLKALGFDTPKHQNQQSVLIDLYRKAKSLEELHQLVRDRVQNSGIRDSILRPLKALTTLSVFTKEPSGSLVADLEAGRAVVFNMSGYDQVTVGPATLPQLYVSMIQRLIVSARENAVRNRGPRDSRLRRKVVLIIDEAPKFLKPGTLSFDELMKAVDLYRYLGVSMVFAAQVQEDVPDKLVDQCRFIFLPYSIKPNDAWKILQACHYYSWHPDAKKRLVDKLRALRELQDGRRPWICVDTERKATDVFYAYPSLSYHQKEGA